MKAYNSNKFFYLYSVFVILPCAFALVFLITQKANDIEVLIMQIAVEIILAITIICVSASVVYHHLLPKVVLEINESTLTLYKAKSHTSYSISDISKAKVWMNNSFTLKSNIYIYGKKTNLEYHVKELKKTRADFIEVLKKSGIEVEEFYEDPTLGD